MNAARASILALVLCWACSAWADVAVPPLTGRVVDQTATLQSSDIDSLTQTLKDFEARKGSQIAVLIVPTTQPESIEQYSIRVADAWKIGRKKIDDGAILLVAKDDRRLRIEVGYGLEGALTDVTSRRIIDEIITPRFHNGDFAGGILAGVDQIMRVIDGEPLPAPSRSASSGVFDGINPFNPFVIVFVLIFGGVMRGVLGRLIGSAVTGGLVACAAWYFVGSLAAALIAGAVAAVFTMISDVFTGPTSGRGGYGGGIGGGFSGGGGSSWSGGGGGGFSGGGGSFGGGGASGSW